MSTRYKGSIISSTAATISSISAKGIWRSNEIMQAFTATTWPSATPAPLIELLVIASGGSAGGTFTGNGGGWVGGG